MANATSEAKQPPVRVNFDLPDQARVPLCRDHLRRRTARLPRARRRARLDHDGCVGSRGGRRGTNIRHRLLGLLRQAVYGRLAGYEVVNDAERLARDPAMRAIVGRAGLDRRAASTSEMGRFETEWRDANLAALAGLPGAWIDRVRGRRPPDGIILAMDSSESPTHGQQEGSAWKGHFGCICYHPSFVFNQYGDLERCTLRPGNAHGAEDWRAVLERVIVPYRERCHGLYFRGDAAFAKPEVYEAAEIGYTIHLPADAVLQERIGHRLTWLVGRPPRKPHVFFASLSCQAQSWTKPRRVVAKGRAASGRAVRTGRVHSQQLEAAGRAGQQVLRRPRYYRAVDPRGRERVTLDAAILPRLPGQRRAAPVPRPCLQPRQLPAIAGPAAAERGVVAHDLREKLVKIGTWIVRHDRYVVFQLAEVAVLRALFAEILRWIERLRGSPIALA
jgi:hypothetical protein